MERRAVSDGETGGGGGGGGSALESDDEKKKKSIERVACDCFGVVDVF